MSYNDLSKSSLITSEQRVIPKSGYTPMKNTAEAGRNNGKLFKLAGMVTKMTL